MAFSMFDTNCVETIDIWRQLSISPSIRATVLLNYMNMTLLACAAAVLTQNDNEYFILMAMLTSLPIVA
jgi:hypothetical protein